MNKSEIKIYFFFTIISFGFVVVTTDFLSLFDIIHLANQMDAISYTEIAKNSPYFPNNSEIVIKHVGQRFLVPYLVGLMANFLSIDLFFVFKIFTFLIIFIYIFLITVICQKFNFNLRISILFFSILFFNPYIIRYSIFNPVQAHDMIFFCLGLIFSISVIYKNFLNNFFTTIFSIYLRQTSIALFIGSSLFLIFNKKFKLLLYLFFFYFLFLFITIKAGDYISIHSFPINLAYGIIFYDFSQIEKLLKFLLLGIIPFFPLGIILFGKINKNINISTILILFFVSCMMIGQPILGGPDGSTNNVGRIANLAYPIITVMTFYIWNFEKMVKNNYLFYFLILILFIWSLHPTYSVLKLFSYFRFYNF